MTHPETPPQRDRSVDPELPGVAVPSAALQAELAAVAAGRGPSYRPRTSHWAAPGVPRYTNRLVRESSPYLLQHAHNPVNWFPWGDEAFDRARRDDKLVFLSVGYATCHWCHVMEHESFEDPDIAAVLNRHFVAVKVDREERPDVDGVYMTSVQMMSGQGGWPMSVWLTPDRRPVYGGTYFPPRDGVRGARVGLVTLLEELARRYRASPAALTAQAERFAEHLRAASAPALPDGVPGPRALRGAVEYLAQSFDPEDGGFGGAPKFPRVSALTLLTRYHRRTGDEHALAMVTHTLERMAAGGIRDHVGGGFHRYAVDDRWIVPHFEKMLYDNAQLALAYLEGFQLTGRADFAAVVRETLRYLSREMASPDGGFYSATDADSPGPDGEAEEGLYFTWTPAELEAVLGAERARIAARYFGVSDRGNFEGRSVLHLPRPLAATAAQVGLAEPELQAVIDSAVAELYAARRRRPPPAVDDKIVTSWNGLAVSAFAKAGFVLDEPAFIAAAARTARFLLDRLRDGAHLLRVYREGAGRQAAFLDDYAFVIAGLLDLYESTGEPSWFAAAVELQHGLDGEFWDDGAGGYFFTARTHEPLLVRDKPDYDGAEPAGNSVAALNLLRLGAWSGHDDHRRRAERVLAAFGDRLTRRGLALPYMLAALDFYLDEPLEIVITAPREAADFAALLAPLRMIFAPNRVASLVLGEGSDAHAALVPLVQGRQPEADGAVAYVCRRGVCELPTRDPAVLARSLDHARPYRDEPPPASPVGLEGRKDAAAERSPTSDE